MVKSTDDRRRQISYKNNKRDDKLLKYTDEQAEIYGLSAYIKRLIEKDMKENKGDDES